MERAEAEAIYEQGRDVVVAVLMRMDEQLRVLSERVARQDERIGQLERQLKRSSRDSSRPPSQDPPSAPPRCGKGRSLRSQGAQPGHEGKGRELLPTSAVDEVVVHWPSECGCGHVFAQGELVGVGGPVRHQVEELPRLAVTVTERQCPRVRCSECGKRPRAELPADVAISAFGPRFHAAIAVLSVRNRVLRRDVVELCAENRSATPNQPRFRQTHAICRGTPSAGDAERRPRNFWRSPACCTRSSPLDEVNPGKAR